ncbi:MAG: NTP transferase domain-containing protein [Thermoleophilia bacterium]|nr:NTP transferase domain-containing protein [Thermoleophilia bacterium]
MKAVVMAGGQGTRLRPLTSNQPKPMVPVVNKPTIQHILELVQRHGISEVVMTLAFLPRLIRNHFGDGSSLGMRIDYTVEETPAGTAGSIRLAKELLTETFLVISGDALTDFDLTQVIDFHKERQALITIALKSVANPLEFGVVIVDEEGRIQRFLEKPGWGQVFSDTVNTGIYVIEPEVLDHIPEGQPYDFSHDLFPKLFDMNKPLYGTVCDGYWQDIGSLEQCLQANRDALDGKVRVTPPGVRLRGNIWVGENAALESLDDVEGPAVIGDNVRIEPGARILSHTVLGNNTVVRAGAQIGGSVLGENVYVAAGAIVEGAILGNAVEVHETAHIAEGSVVGDRSIIGRNAVVANNVKVYPFKNVEPGSTVRTSIVWETRGPSTLFGRNGVRGLANVDVTPEMAMRLAMSYGTLVGKGTYVATSRDTHQACRVTKRAIISGLNSTGVNVRDLTMAPLAVNRFDIKSGNAVGGIHVRMSLENPEQIEILFSEAPGVPADGKRERAIENNYFREDYRRADFEEMGQVVYPPRVIETYTNALLDNWNTVAIRGRQPRLVLDYSSSAPGFFFSSTLDSLGVEAVSLNTFSRARDRFTLAQSLPPAVARVGDLVRAMEADLGAILDPGAEYLYIVDEKGDLVSDSALLLLLLQNAARQAGSGAAALPLHATRLGESVVASTGVSIRRTRCSKAALMAEAARPSTIFAASTDGGYIYPSVLACMDGLYALGKVLELVSLSDAPLSQLVAQAPVAHVAHLVSECPWETKGQVMRLMTEKLREGRVSLVDGIKVFLDHSEWALVLPDAEEPLFHVYAEANAEERAQELAEEYRGILETAILEARSA